jgi:hypothetical protein
LRGTEGRDNSAEKRAKMEEVNLNYSTVWISDLHLGTRHCNARGVLEFVRRVQCKTLYLVGDVVDVWALRRSHYWHQTHNDVLQQLLRKARKGTRLTIYRAITTRFPAVSSGSMATSQCGPTMCM